MKELAGKYRRRNIFLGIVLLIAGVIISGLLLSDYLPKGEVLDLDYATADEIREGRAHITVFDVYDYYSYMKNSAGAEVTRDYLVSFGADGTYIGVELSGSKNDKIYENLERIIEFENNWTDNTSDEEVAAFYDSLNYVEVKGTVKPISGEDIQYYDSFLKEIKLAYGLTDAEMNELFVPYVVVPAQIGDGDTYSYVGLVLGLGLLAGGLYMIFNGIFGDMLKDVTAYGKKIGSKEFAMQKAENMYRNTSPAYSHKAISIKVNDELYMIETNGQLFFGNVEDILWIYEYVVTRKQNFIPVGKDYYVKIRRADGKEVQISTNKKEIDNMIQDIVQIFPDAIAGYNDNINNIYNKNRQQMILEVARRHDARVGNAAGSTI